MIQCRSSFGYLPHFWPFTLQWAQFVQVLHALQSVAPAQVAACMLDAKARNDIQRRVFICPNVYHGRRCNSTVE
jgi:hypothetical protein